MSDTGVPVMTGTEKGYDSNVGISLENPFRQHIYYMLPICLHQTALNRWEKKQLKREGRGDK